MARDTRNSRSGGREDNRGDSNNRDNRNRDNRRRDGRRNDSRNSDSRSSRSQKPKVETPFTGILEMIGDKKFGFIRELTKDVRKGDDDPFVPPPMVKRHKLRDGVVVTGTWVEGKKGASQVHKIETVMGVSADDWALYFTGEQGQTIYPDEKLNLVASPADVATRVVDLVAPIGKGQRVLLVAPPKAGKTILLKQMAAGIKANHDEVDLVALLVDERPEEVTDFSRSVPAMVFASSNDRDEDNHVRVATLAFEYARRRMEMGRDVVLLLDSLTRLGRTFNIYQGGKGRTLSGGLDSRALNIPRKIFGGARNIENGGSLTIIATALIGTGSKMDEIILEEFKGTGNAEIVLDRRIADKRIYPAVNIRKSGTRNADRLMGKYARQHDRLFGALNSRAPEEALIALIRQIKVSETNESLMLNLIH